MCKHSVVNKVVIKCSYNKYKSDEEYNQRYETITKQRFCRWFFMLIDIVKPSAFECDQVCGLAKMLAI